MVLKLLHTNKYFCNYTCKTLKSLNKQSLSISILHFSTKPDRSPKAVLNKPIDDDDDIEIEWKKPDKVFIEGEKIEEESAYDVALRMRKAEKVSFFRVLFFFPNKNRVYNFRVHLN